MSQCFYTTTEVAALISAIGMFFAYGIYPLLVILIPVLVFVILLMFLYFKGEYNNQILQAAFVLLTMDSFAIVILL